MKPPGWVGGLGSSQILGLDPLCAALAHSFLLSCGECSPRSSGDSPVWGIQASLFFQKSFSLTRPGHGWPRTLSAILRALAVLLQRKVSGKKQNKTDKDRESKAVPGDLPSIAHLSFSWLASYIASVLGHSVFP